MPEDPKPNPINPPKGDVQKAEKYISKLIDLITQDKITVHHTDLKRFDPGSLQDHYYVDLKEYRIEISHSKLPQSGSDSYVMIFTNIKNITQGSSDKIVLAYTQLADEQFSRFKSTAESQLEKIKKAEEEKRFNEALSPIDDLLNDHLTQNNDSATEPGENQTKSESVDGLDMYPVEGPFGKAGNSTSLD